MPPILEDISTPLDAYLSARGLSAKLSVIAEHGEALLDGAAETEIGRRAEAEPGTIPAPEIEAFLLARLREDGPKDGANAFANALLGAWLGRSTLAEKAGLMDLWSDPIATPPAIEGLERVADEAEAQGDAASAAFHGWHARLARRCAEHGVEAGAAVHEAAEGMAVPEAPGAGDEAAGGGGSVGPQALLAEVQALQGRDDARSITRRIEIYETLLSALPEEGPDDLLLARAALSAELASALDDALSLGIVDPRQVPTVQDRVDGLYDYALEIYRRLEREVEAAGTAQNWAILLLARYETGDAEAGDRADGLFDYALEIRRRLEREVDAAITAQNWAMLLQARYETGDAEAGDRADGLYEEALEIFRRLKREVEAATTAQNRANLLLARYESGDADAGDRADGLYAEALEIRRRLKREVEAAATAQNWAILLLARYENGDAGAGDRADGLYDYALEIRRRLEHEVDAARTAQNWANLLVARYEAGDTGAGDRADGLYDYALEIRRRLEREVEVAQTAQNWATLFTRRYENGDAGAGERADGLYAEALEIRRRLEREVEVAQTAQNWANLLQRRYENGDAGARERADGLFAEALEIRRRLEREVEVAQTAQNWANLLQRRYENGDAGARDRADGLYEEALEIFRRLERGVEAATTAQNWATLLLARYENGDAGAGDRADALYAEALEALPAGASPITRLQIQRNRLGLWEAGGRWSEVAAGADVVLRKAQARLPQIADRASRDLLLTNVAGVGRRGAWAALGAVDGGDAPPDPLSEAVRFLEAGRAQQLGARMREMEADLSANERAALDDARLRLSVAERAVEAAQGHDPEAAATRQAAYEALQALLEQFGLSYVDVAPPAPEVLAAALGAAPGGGAIVQVVWGPAGAGDGALLVLTAADPRWRVVPVPGLDQAAVDGLLGAHMAALEEFGSALGGGDGSASNVDILAAFSGAIDRNLHPAAHGLAVEGAAEAPSAWALVMGPLAAALEAAGLAPAGMDADGRDGGDAPEVVLCLPAELGSIPLEAARGPDGRPFLARYATSRTPSLTAFVAAAARAARLTGQAGGPDAPAPSDAPAPQDGAALVITDPIGDLGVGHDVVPDDLLPPARVRQLRAAPWLEHHGVAPTAAPDADWRAGWHAGADGPPGVGVGVGVGSEPLARLASWDNVKAAVAERAPYWLIYFGHSHHDPQDGEGSGLLLSAPPAPEGDAPADGDAPARPAGDLTGPPRLRDLPLEGTRLAFSASCGGAGLGLGTARDEMGGLPAAWLEAGAAAMISSLHPVLVGPAQEVLRAAMVAMTAGARPAQALRRAQLDLARTMETPAPAHGTEPQTNPAPDDHPGLRADPAASATTATAKPDPNTRIDRNQSTKTRTTTALPSSTTTAAAFAFVSYGA